MILKTCCCYLPLYCANSSIVRNFAVAVDKDMPLCSNSKIVFMIYYIGINLLVRWLINSLHGTTASRQSLMLSILSSPIGFHLRIKYCLLQSVFLHIAADQEQLAHSVKTHVSLSVEHTTFCVEITCKLCSLFREFCICMNGKKYNFLGSLFHFQRCSGLDEILRVWTIQSKQLGVSHRMSQCTSQILRNNNENYDDSNSNNNNFCTCCLHCVVSSTCRFTDIQSSLPEHRWLYPLFSQNLTTHCIIW
jgi:hypothetical protein